MDKEIIARLVCPITKGPLVYLPEAEELVSLAARLAYPIKDGIPVMLAEQARELPQSEYEVLRAAHPPRES